MPRLPAKRATQTPGRASSPGEASSLRAERMAPNMTADALEVIDPDSAPMTMTRNGRTIPASISKIRGLQGLVQELAGAHYRVAAGALMAGCSYALAANLAGISQSAMADARKKRPDLAALLTQCEQIGFGLYELELQKRALAGDQDRGSIRALEIVAKSRRAEYREKSAIAIDVIHRAEQSASRLVGGWDTQPSSDSNETEPI